MNICEVTYNWPAETFLQRHVQAMQAIGFPVRLAARHWAAKADEHASLGGTEADFPVEILPNFDHLDPWGKIAALRYLTAKSLVSPHAPAISQKALLGYFDRLQPDLIHFHTASLAAMMAWIPQALGIPYTLSLRGSDVQVLPLQSPAQRDATAEAVAGARKVHAVCEALAKTAADWLGVRIAASVIYTTVPIPPVLPERENLPYGGEIHFISSGRLMWCKGFDNLLLALHAARRQGLNARLTLVGAGTDLDSLLYLRKVLGLEDTVDLPGKLPYEQIQALFGCAHAYIQSSVAEGLSNSLAEAMANGLPVFATDVGGTREVVEDGVTGFLLPPFEPQAWVEKLLLARDNALMQRVRQAAYEKAIRLFSAEQHARQFAAFYQQALCQ